ncbi:MAG TPA: response regulator [Pseudonocardiaceae bacterium]|jgi:DNA-binding NarL/FixJ family response regulator
MVAGDGAEQIRVLIADDDPRVRAALRVFLSANEGFEVVGEAANMAGALELARSCAPTVALVDVYLPGREDGLALLRALNEDLRIPVVAISLDNTACDSALEAGAYRFLAKESVPDLLLDVLGMSAQRDG